MNRRMTNSFTISPHEGSTEHDRTERKSIDRKLKNERDRLQDRLERIDYWDRLEY